MKRSCAAALLSLIVSTGCHVVPNAPHQIKLAPPPPEVSFKTTPADGYRFAAIEFDDIGDVFSMDETTRALEEIAAANEEAKRNGDEGRGAMVLIFVHGWKHNADENDENLRNFKATMAELVKEEQTYLAIHNAQPENRDKQWHLRPYVGVYLGWRGDSLNFSPRGSKVASALRNLSYYDRNAAASRVGGVTAIEVLSDLFHAAKENSPSTITVAVGHSMGGLILEQSMIYYLAAAVKDRAFNGTAAVRPADLIVLVNQASPAVRAQHFLNLLKRANVHAPLAVNAYTKYLSDDQRQAGPLIVSITSTADKATNGIFRVAYSLLAKGISLRDQYQHFLMTMTAGHAEPLWSHKLDVINAPAHKEEDGVASLPWEPIRPCSAARWARSSADDGPVALCFAIGDPAVDEEKRTIYRLTSIVRKPDAFVNDTPYWIVPVNESVISNHTDIFNPVFRNLLRGLVHYTTEGFTTYPMLTTNDPYRAVDPRAEQQNGSGGTLTDALLSLFKHYWTFSTATLTNKELEKLRREVDDTVVKFPLNQICADLKPGNAAPAGQDQPHACRFREQPPDVYVVMPGDWLSKIASRFYGDAQFWGPLYAANRTLRNPDLIFPGQRLRIPPPCPSGPGRGTVVAENGSH